MRHRSHYVRAAALGALVLVAALGGAFAVTEWTRSYGSARLFGVVGAAGLVALVYGLAGIARSSRSARSIVILGVVALALLGAFAIAYEFSEHETRRISLLCSEARGSYFGEDSLAARRSKLDEAERRRSATSGRIAAIIVAIVQTHPQIAERCEDAKADFDRVDRGLCPARLTGGVSCTCGRMIWPARGSCEHPECLYGGALPGGWEEGLYCQDPRGMVPWQPP